jgi:hypothetical protein
VADNMLKDSLPRRPYLHFWRCQWEKLFLAALIGAALWWGTYFPDHAWNAELKVFVSQAIVILLWMLRGTWTDPSASDGPKPTEDK